MPYPTLTRPLLFPLMIRPPPSPNLLPYPTLFRSRRGRRSARAAHPPAHRRSAAAENSRGSPPRLERRGEIGRHTSELQSHVNLVCRLLLEKKNITHSTL